MSEARRARWWCGIARAALAAVFLALPLGFAVRAEPPLLTGPPKGADRPVGTLAVASPWSRPGEVQLRWTGRIGAPMAEHIERSVAAFAPTRRRFVLILDSGGGSVAEGEKVIALLQTLRRTHRVDTVVERGSRCGSMCVPIYLQGQTRYGARASTWLFHEVTRRPIEGGKAKLVGGGYRRLIEKYWIPAGVSREWIERTVPLSSGFDYWQTGQDLIAERAGIINQPIENRRDRRFEDSDVTHPGSLSEGKALPPAVPPATGASVPRAAEPRVPAPPREARPALPQPAPVPQHARRAPVVVDDPMPGAPPVLPPTREAPRRDFRGEIAPARPRLP